MKAAMEENKVDEPEYVIRSVGNGYFRETTKAGPMFGASLKDTPRFVWESAHLTINAMPSSSSRMCEVVRVKSRKKKAA